MLISDNLSNLVMTETISSAVAERSRDASCPLVVSLNKTSCAARWPPQYAPAHLDFWPFDLGVGVGVACDLGYHCAKFRLPRPFGFRVRADVRDIRQTDRRTDDRRRWPPNVPACRLPYGGGGNRIIMTCVESFIIVTQASDLPLRNVVFGIMLRLLVIHFVVFRHRQTPPNYQRLVL